MATIKQIAEKARVSIATVSRILNLDETLSVADETRARVIRIAEELEYTPRRKKKRQVDPTAQPERKIALLQWHSEQQELNDLFYLQIQNAIEQEAIALGYRLAYVTLEDFTHAGDDTYAGILAVGKYDDSEVQAIANKELPVVFVGLNALMYGFDSIGNDFTSPVKWIIDHYQAQGISDIGLISGEEPVSNSLDTQRDPRLEAFELFMKRAHIYNPDQVFLGDFSPASGYALMNQAITKLGNDLPHGFIIGNDAMAVGVVRALNENNILIPDRVSLISFNDVTVAKFTTPKLSTVHVHTGLVGKQAMQMLIKRLKNPDRVPQFVTFGTEIIYRESSK